MRAEVWLYAALLCVLAGVTGCGGGTQSALPLPTHAPVALNASGYIKHVVIIIQENRSFDNLFYGFPGADSATAGVLSDGRSIQMQPENLDALGDLPHQHFSYVMDYDGGKMDGFDRATANAGAPIQRAYTYVPQAQLRPYWDLASQYALADRMFQSNSGPSFPAHLYLVGGQSAFATENPFNQAFMSDPRQWSCLAVAGTTVDTMTPAGAAGPPVFPCFDFKTIADELAQTGQTWRYYAPQLGADVGFQWSAYSAIKHIINDPSAWGNVVSPETKVLTDAPKGDLAAVTWVVPSLVNSDHRQDQTHVGGGPDWVASVVNAIGTSSAWDSTAIFITWDDWGGFYDHVVPPAGDVMGPGFRVPLIVVSPYAKHGYVSHVNHEFGSILRFTEEAMHLPSLGTRDAASDDLSDMFDFSQAPAPYTPVRTLLKPQYFLRQIPSRLPPDDD